jgi:hypothetical protein
MGNAIAAGFSKGGLSNAPVAGHRYADAGEQYKGPVERTHRHRRSQPTIEARLYDGLRNADMYNRDDIITCGTPGSDRRLRLSSRACRHHSSWFALSNAIATFAGTDRGPESSSYECRPACIVGRAGSAAAPACQSPLRPR